MRFEPILLSLVAFAQCGRAAVVQPVAPVAPTHSTAEPERAVKPNVDVVPVPEPAPRTLAEVAPWLELNDHLAERLAEFEWQPQPGLTTDADARAYYCSTSHGQPAPCVGPGPWLISVQPYDTSWAYLLVDVREAGWVSSDLFGENGLNRCGASTDAALRTGASALEVEVEVEDYYEFTDDECEEEDEQGECIEWMSSCGTPFEAKCIITFDASTLEALAVEGECSAQEVGQAQGHYD